jgi:hypothetical protein
MYSWPLFDEFLISLIDDRLIAYERGENPSVA